MCTKKVDDNYVSEYAYKWVKENIDFIVNKFVGDISSVERPISFFMAGSPGSGKTEYSKYFIKDLNKKFQERYNKNFPVIRLDIDDIRPICPNYNGKNASCFQRASVLVINKLHDYVLKKKINFLLDGTFANLDYAVENIERSLVKGREVQIFYLFQDPINAWNLTLARQNKDGRVVPLDVFIEDYFSAKEVVNKVKKLFNEKVRVDLIIKDYATEERKVYFNISNIDTYIKLPYNRTTLKNILM